MSAGDDIERVKEALDALLAQDSWQKPRVDAALAALDRLQGRLAAREDTELEHAVRGYLDDLDTNGVANDSGLRAALESRP